MSSSASSPNAFSGAAGCPGPTHGIYRNLHAREFPESVSLVFPMFNEEQVLAALRAEVTAFIDQLPTRIEVVLVDDGSTDQTLALAVDWSRADARVRVLQLARNFGHQAAATAGLDFASGEAVVLMDADLQDPPPVVSEMIQRYCEGYDVVYGQRGVRRGETPMKRLTAWLFYRLMRKFVYKHLPVDTGDFRLMSRVCLDALKRMHETHRFLRGMVAWIGFPQCSVVYERAARLAGTTKYPLKKMLSFAWTAATSFSILPLRISLYLSVLASIFGVEEASRALLARLLGHVVPGWTSLMIVTSLIGSAILFCMAILGQYVGLIYEQSKERPLYLVSHLFCSREHEQKPSCEQNAEVGLCQVLIR